MTEDSKDCLECRLISGFGLIGVSAYIYYQAKHRKKWENYTMKTISAGKYFPKKTTMYEEASAESKKYLERYKLLKSIAALVKFTTKLKRIIKVKNSILISRCRYARLCSFT